MCYRKREKGIVLVFSVILLFAFSAIVIRYGSLISHEAKVAGIQVGESQAVYLAEAGINYALWALIHGFSPAQIQGQKRYLPPESTGKFFTIISVIDTYAFQKVTFTATASSYTTGHTPNLAVDKNLDTYWESNIVPGSEWICLKSSSPISFDRVSFMAIPGQRPIDYKWQVEKKLHPKTGEVQNWDTVFTASDNTLADVTDVFDNGVVNNKFYLRLLVSEAGDGTTKTRVAVKEIEIPPCVHIESQGTVQYPQNNLTKTVAQDFWVDTRTDPFTITRVSGTWQEK